MKRLLTLLLIWPLLSAFGTLPPPSFVAAIGSLHGKPYELVLFYAEHESTLWNPEKDEWPMATTEAIRVAREALRKVVGTSAAYFGCTEVRLKRFHASPQTERPQWYFLVVFESDHESVAPRVDGGGWIPAVLPFVVFPEGYVKSPTPKAK